jgi:hypothetical protein
MNVPQAAPRHARGWRRLQLSAILLLLALPQAYGVGDAVADDARYLIFHVDAISWESFQRARAAGLLPHLEAMFADGLLRPALSLFPGGTSMIYSRLRSGAANDAPGPLGFASYDRDSGTPIAEVLPLIASLPRRARGGFPHGWFAFGAGELAMRNVPALLERYRVVQFFWFATDTIGHVEGEAAMLASLARFDHALGVIAPRLDLEKINVIVYGDHGLSFAEEVVDVYGALREVVGDRVKYVQHPNLYLHDAAQAPAVARELTEGGHFDFAIYRSGPERVAGYLYGEPFELAGIGDKIAYWSPGDPFDYASAGIAQGEPLTPDGWLAATIDHPYPAAVVNLYRYAQNRHTGDVIFGVNPPRIPPGSIPFVGHHAGLAATDLLVPVLVRGPDLQHLMREEPFWLHTLYRDVEVDPFSVRQVREDHQLLLWIDSQRQWALEGRYSPAYRWRLATEVAPGRWLGWGEWDAYSDYLVRLWIGAGVAWDARGGAPYARLSLEVDVAELRLTPALAYQPGEWRVGIGLQYAVGAHGVFAAQSPTRVGVGVRW